jgi:hypothetical protein
MLTLGETQIFHDLKEEVMVSISIYLAKTEGNVDITELLLAKSN